MFRTHLVRSNLLGVGRGPATPLALPTGALVAQTLAELNESLHCSRLLLAPRALTIARSFSACAPPAVRLTASKSSLPERRPLASAILRYETESRRLDEALGPPIFNGADTAAGGESDPTSVLVSAMGGIVEPAELDAAVLAMWKQSTLSLAEAGVGVESGEGRDLLVQVLVGEGGSNALQQMSLFALSRVSRLAGQSYVSAWYGQDSELAEQAAALMRQVAGLLKQQHDAGSVSSGGPLAAYYWLYAAKGLLQKLAAQAGTMDEQARKRQRQGGASGTPLPGIPAAAAVDPHGALDHDAFAFELLSLLAPGARAAIAQLGGSMHGPATGALPAWTHPGFVKSPQDREEAEQHAQARAMLQAKQHFASLEAAAGLSPTAAVWARQAFGGRLEHLTAAIPVADWCARLSEWEEQQTGWLAALSTPAGLSTPSASSGDGAAAAAESEAHPAAAGSSGSRAGASTSSPGSASGAVGRQLNLLVAQDPYLSLWRNPYESAKQVSNAVAFAAQACVKLREPRHHESDSRRLRRQINAAAAIRVGTAILAEILPECAAAEAAPQRRLLRAARMQATLLASVGNGPSSTLEHALSALDLASITGLMEGALLPGAHATAAAAGGEAGPDTAAHLLARGRTLLAITDTRCWQDAWSPAFKLALRPAIVAWAGDVAAHFPVAEGDAVASLGAKPPTFPPRPSSEPANASSSAEQPPSPPQQHSTVVDTGAGSADADRVAHSAAAAVSGNGTGTGTFPALHAASLLRRLMRRLVGASACEDHVAGVVVQDALLHVLSAARRSNIDGWRHALTRLEADQAAEGADAAGAAVATATEAVATSAEADGASTAASAAFAAEWSARSADAPALPRLARLLDLRSAATSAGAPVEASWPYVASALCASHDMGLPLPPAIADAMPTLLQLRKDASTVESLADDVSWGLSSTRWEHVTDAIAGDWPLTLDIVKAVNALEECRMQLLPLVIAQPPGPDCPLRAAAAAAGTGVKHIADAGPVALLCAQLERSAHGLAHWAKFTTGDSCAHTFRDAIHWASAPALSAFTRVYAEAAWLLGQDVPLPVHACASGRSVATDGPASAEHVAGFGSTEIAASSLSAPPPQRETCLRLSDADTHRLTQAQARALQMLRGLVLLQAPAVPALREAGAFRDRWGDFAEASAAAPLPVAAQDDTAQQLAADRAPQSKLSPLHRGSASGSTGAGPLAKDAVLDEDGTVEPGWQPFLPLWLCRTVSEASAAEFNAYQASLGLRAAAEHRVDSKQLQQQQRERRSARLPVVSATNSDQSANLDALPHGAVAPDAAQTTGAESERVVLASDGAASRPAADVSADGSHDGGAVDADAPNLDRSTDASSAAGSAVQERAWKKMHVRSRFAARLLIERMCHERGWPMPQRNWRPDWLPSANPIMLAWPEQRAACIFAFPDRLAAEAAHKTAVSVAERAVKTHRILLSQRSRTAAGDSDSSKASGAPALTAAASAAVASARAVVQVPVVSSLRGRPLSLLELPDSSDSRVVTAAEALKDAGFAVAVITPRDCAVYDSRSEFAPDHQPEIEARVWRAKTSSFRLPGWLGRQVDRAEYTAGRLVLAEPLDGVELRLLQKLLYVYAAIRLPRPHSRLEWPLATPRAAATAGTDADTDSETGAAAKNAAVVRSAALAAAVAAAVQASGAAVPGPTTAAVARADAVRAASAGSGLLQTINQRAPHVGLEQGSGDRERPSTAVGSGPSLPPGALSAAAMSTPPRFAQAEVHSDALAAYTATSLSFEALRSSRQARSRESRAGADSHPLR